MAEKLRLDKYLWSIRIFKTRTLAAAAIDSGKVRTADGQAVKASRTVGIGDKYEIRTPARKWIIEVSGLLANRAAYDVAVQHYIDLTPEEDKVTEKPLSSSFFTGKRLSKTGRPTKKQRRDLNDLLGGEDTPQMD
ncbi:RNA-binding S4 domain-containing protein [Rurimicrobium arvi]|uniref:S4 domain-containing protein n=1 Tax=Rurimicrobium arvi TaxID=2049916 RepID=A0ABP8MJX9_9BACT